MSAQRSQFFYQEVSLTADYGANDFELKFTSRHVKMKLSNGGSDECEFSLIGDRDTKVDGKLLDGESETFDGLECDKIAVRGTGTLRLWAWK